MKYLRSHQISIYRLFQHSSNISINYKNDQYSHITNEEENIVSFYQKLIRPLVYQQFEMYRFLYFNGNSEYLFLTLLLIY